MPQRSLWIDRLKEYASDRLPSGETIEVVNQFRRWGEFNKPNEKWGCPNRNCRRKLYDRLTLWLVDGYLMEHHLNSSSALARLRKLETRATTVFSWRQAGFLRGRQDCPEIR